MRLRGGAEVGAAWKNKRLVALTLKAKRSGTIRLKVPAYAAAIQMNGKELLNEKGFVVMTMEEGESALLNVISE